MFTWLFSNFQRYSVYLVVMRGNTGHQVLFMESQVIKQRVRCIRFHDIFLDFKEVMKSWSLLGRCERYQELYMKSIGKRSGKLAVSRSQYKGLGGQR